MAGIFALTWLTTKFLAKRLPGGSRTSHLQIIERLPLGKDRQVALLKVGDEHFLIGIAGQQISISTPVRLGTPNYAEIQEKVNQEHGNDASTHEETSPKSADD